MAESDGGGHKTARPRRLLRDALGEHVPQLLHIQQLKQRITQQHRALLDAAIADKMRRNEALLQEQQVELAARRQRKQQRAIAQTASSDSMTDVHPSSAAATTDSAPIQPAAAATPAVATASPPAPLASNIPLPSSSELAALTFSRPSGEWCSESQLLALLPPVVAVSLLHCGFSSAPRSTLAVLSEATMDFIRHAGVALRDAQDETAGKRKARHKAKVGVKAETGVESRSWLTPRLLRALGLRDVRPLQRFYERSVVRAGQRVRQTEQRLTRIEAQLQQQQPDTVLQMNGGDIDGDASGGGSSWLCEPFSPLRTFVHPPIMPATPPPLEEEKVEEPPAPPSTDASSGGSGGGAAMAVEAQPSEVQGGAQRGQGASGANEQSTTANVGAQASDAVPSTASAAGDEQATALPPLEHVDGLPTTQPTQPVAMVE